MALADPRVVQCTNAQGPKRAIAGTRTTRELEARLRHPRNSIPGIAQRARMLRQQQQEEAAREESVARISPRDGEEG